MSEFKVHAIDYGYFEAKYDGGLGIVFTACDEVEAAGGIFTTEQAREAARGLFKLADEMALREMAGRR